MNRGPAPSEDRLPGVLSISGTKMASRSGLRSIMEDIASTPTNGSVDHWINLSIGNPASIPEVVAMWKALTQDAVASAFETTSCQYGPSRGTAILLGALARYFNERYDWGLTTDNIVIGPGSQTLCFAAAALFTGRGEKGMKSLLLPAVPDYTGYQGLSLDTGVVVGIPSTVVPEAGTRSFRYSLDMGELDRQENVGMMLLSSPCNPTGRCLTDDELSSIVALAESRGVPLVIDHAYGLPFPQVARAVTPPIRHPNVINCFSISKAGLPGERIGFAVGEADYTDAMTSFISNAMLHAPQLPQIVLARALESGTFDRAAREMIRPYYERKRTFAEKALVESFPESVRWRLHSGQGGMFCWLWIDEPWFDDNAFYELMKERGVFIVPGRHFFVDPSRLSDHGTKCFRISLTADEASIVVGIGRMARALEELSCAASC